MISDYVEGLNMVFGDKIVMAKSPEDFWEKIDYFIKNPDDRLEYIQNGFNEVINHHTYFHRVEDIFRKLNMKTHADHCKNTYDKIKERL